MGVFKSRTLGLLAAALVLLPAVAYAQVSRWGVFDEIALREWVTDKEPRPRVSKFQWTDDGRVLVARHGFVSRLQFGEARFADTVQSFVLDPKTGLIDVTYTYEDGRPALKSVIRINSDATAVETFRDAAGVEFRNTYRSPSPSINTIERERREGAAWATLGTTRKTGLTRQEIAENARRAEDARQMAMAQARAQEAERQAQIAADDAQQEAEQAAYQADQAARQQSAQNTPNMLDVLNGIGASIQRDNQQRQAQFDRQLQQAVQEQARQKADAARAEAQRIAAENSRRVQEANARQAAISAQYAQQRAVGGAQGVAQTTTAAPTRTRVQGQLGQTPLGGFPAPIIAPNTRTSPPMGSGGTQFGAATLECLPKYAHPTYKQTCEDNTKPLVD